LAVYRKKDFLIGKSEKKGIMQGSVDEEEDAQSESDKKQNQNNSSSDMQIDKKN